MWEFELGDGTALPAGEAREAVLNQPNTAGAPAKADAVQQKQFTGLCEALNTNQKYLAAKHPGYVPDIYEVVFNPTTMGASTIKHAGDVNHSATPMASYKQLITPKSQAIAVNARGWSVQQGTPILQFIDMVMRNSSFINAQATMQYDEITWAPLPQSPSGKKGITWFKISMLTEQLPQYDTIRNDFAYKITFLITPYRVFNVISPDFPISESPGVHKSYNYWFTGKNIEIIGYEQTFNYQWYALLTGLAQPKPLLPSGEDVIRRAYRPLSGQNNQGADGITNEPSANAADSLYSPSDYKEVKLTIVGDPAWIAQGEISSEISPRDFDFNPFNKDGTINFDAGQVCFRVVWNQPSDYDLTTGIMNVSNTPKQDVISVTKSVKSMFIKGKFTQEVIGIFFPYALSRPNSKPAAEPTAKPVAGVRPAAEPPAKPVERDIHEEGKGSDHRLPGQQPVGPTASRGVIP